MPQPTPQDYALIFDDHRIGAAILEDLILRFTKPIKSTGIDRVLDSAVVQGRREVLDFILMRINQSNGVKDDENTDE